MFSRVDAHPKNPGAYVLTYPKTYGDLAMDQITGLGAYLKHTYGTKPLKYFTSLARDRYDTMTWDEVNNRPRSKIESELQAIADTADSIPWMIDASKLPGQKSETLETLATNRPRRGQDTDGDSIYHRNKNNIKEGDSIADDSSIGSITTAASAATTNSTRVKLANVCSALRNMDMMAVPEHLRMKDPDACAAMAAFFQSQVSNLLGDPPQEGQTMIVTGNPEIIDLAQTSQENDLTDEEEEEEEADGKPSAKTNSQQDEEDPEDAMDESEGSGNKTTLHSSNSFEDTEQFAKKHATSKSSTSEEKDPDTTTRMDFDKKNGNSPPDDATTTATEPSKHDGSEAP